jgi:acetylornithine deacetylase/succinyl-diaminopimelate desuccinylase-like protein
LEADVEVKTKAPLYSSYVMERSDPLVELFDSVYREVKGEAPHYEYSSSITDANTFAGEGGIPCIHMGPYAGGPHQKNEYTKIDSLPPATEIYTRMAARYLK